MNEQRPLSPSQPAPVAPVYSPPVTPLRAVKQQRSRRLVPAVLLILVALVLLAWGARFLVNRLNFVHESDARIVADVTLISSRIAGRIVEMPISEGMQVTRDQVVVVIDNRSAKLKMTETTAQLNAIVAERDRVGAEIKMVDLRTRRQYESEQSKLAAAKALLQSFDLEFSYSATEYRRAQALSKKGVIARRQLEIARTAYLKAQQARLRARAQVASAQAELGAAEAERQRINVLESERTRLQHKIAERQAQIENQLLDIQDRDLKSPLAGVISRTFVTRGEFVSPGQRIALVHDPNDIWVEALVKETDIRKLKLGQLVAVHIDAYPEQKFEGKIVRIGHAATSQFSLLPNPNPSGNFTKVTQRLPVRIALEQRDGLLKPGMMVEVSVDVRKR